MARLSGVRQLGDEWSPEAKRFFIDESIKSFHKGELTASVHGYNITSKGCFVSLRIRNKMRVLLNDALVKKGLGDIERPAFHTDNFKLECTEKIQGSCQTEVPKHPQRRPRIAITVQSILEYRMKKNHG